MRSGELDQMLAVVILIVLPVSCSSFSLLRAHPLCRFLQPGLLLRGVDFGDVAGQDAPGEPRRSWALRSSQQAVAVAAGLTEWQANPYYCAGHVAVPALMDAFLCSNFVSRGLPRETLAELAGEGPSGTEGGAALRQIPLPSRFLGQKFGTLFQALLHEEGLICLGLYRRKVRPRGGLIGAILFGITLNVGPTNKRTILYLQHENPLSRLPYVFTNPPADVVLMESDKVFVLRTLPIET